MSSFNVEHVQLRSVCLMCNSVEMDCKKYNYLEPTLQKILSKHISLQDDEIKHNNLILRQILLLIKRKLIGNKLFEHLYYDIFYGGSYYDGLRVGHPNEFDIDLLLKLPKELGTCVERSELNGFVYIQIKNLLNFKKQQHLMKKYHELLNYIDEDNYLRVDKILSWFESVVTMRLHKLFSNGYYTFPTTLGTFFAKIHKSGPAFTLKICQTKGVHLMDVDLVPCFVFTQDKWPKGFKMCPLPKNPSNSEVTTAEEFFVVPKPLKTDQRKWRLSFQQQERLIIQEKKNLKPTLKLMKQMRDILGHNQIASYYIKTIFIWLATTKDTNYWTNSLSFIFMESLMYYRDQLKKGKIKYFWDEQNNLLTNINPDHITALGNQIDVIITKIENNITEPHKIKKYLLNSPSM